jgi:hypothetical protein
MALFQLAEHLVRETEDPHWRVMGLRAIALARQRAGLNAVDTFAEARRACAMVEDAKLRALALCMTAIAQSKAGLDSTEPLREACAAAAAVEGIPERASTLAEIAAILVDAQLDPGDAYAEAMRVALSGRDSTERDQALLRVARRTIGGLPSQARRLARMFIRSSYRVAVLEKLVDEHACAGDVTTAIELAAEIEEAHGQGRALGTVVRFLARSERFAEALDLARGIEPTFACDSALADIATSLAMAGRFDEATSINRRLSPPAREHNSSRIAAGLACAGRVDDALEIAATLDGDERDHVLEHVVRAYVEDGRSAEALAAARAIEFRDAHTRALMLVAAHRIRTGRIGEAWALADDPAFHIARDDILYAMSTTDAGTRPYAAVVALATMIADPNIRGAAQGAIAEALAEAGRYIEALRHARASEAEEWVYARVAVAQAHAGLLDDALRLAGTLVAPAHRVWVIEQVLVTAYPAERL